MASVLQKLKIRKFTIKLKNKNSKFKIISKKYNYSTNNKENDKTTKKYSYISKKKVFGKKYRYVYKYS